MSNTRFFPDGFLSFLPLDNDGIKNVDSERFMETLSEDLAFVLRLTDNDFWNLVNSEDTLNSTLDSFLRFRQRGFDDTKVSSLIAKNLEHRMLLVFLRLVTVPEKSNSEFREQQATLLYEKWIVDIPKILDLCCLYGKQNPTLAREFLEKTFQLEPKYLNDLKEMVPTVLENLYLLEDRCNDTLVQIQKGDQTGLLGWIDVFKYLLDVCFNLCAFLELYPAGGSCLMQDKGILFCSLAQIHDILLIQFQQAIQELMLQEEIAELEELLKMTCIVQAAIEKVAFVLVRATFLTEDTTKPHVSAENGQQLMSVVMSCARLDDENEAESLLCKVNERHHLGDLIIQSIERGSLSLDDAQFDYLSMLFSSNKRPTALMPAGKMQSAIKPSTSSVQASESNDIEKATLLSKINQIKDILPDYGDHFLEYCLKEFSMDPEKVIAHILEGSLPSSISSLDPHLTKELSTNRTFEVSNGAPSSSAGPSRGPYSNGASSSYQHLLPDNIGVGWDVSNPVQEIKQEDIAPTQSKGTSGKKKIDRRTARVLDQSGAEVRRIIIQQANELLLDDYEDEYDDSYDDLGVSGTDGLADVEGDLEESNNKGSGEKQQSKRPYYVKDGKIYNAPVKGSVEVVGQDNARRMASQRDTEIYGLGPGGNIPENSNGAPPQAPVTNPKRGRGRQRGGRGRGKSHHQKERNLRKQQF